MKMPSLSRLFSCPLLMFAACGPVMSYVQTGPGFPPLSSDEQIYVYLSKGPAYPYQELGVIEAAGSTLAERVAAAKLIARQQGGNGLILLGSNTTVRVMPSQHSSLGPGTLSTDAGLCLPTTEFETYAEQLFVVIAEQRPGAAVTVDLGSITAATAQTPATSATPATAATSAAPATPIEQGALHATTDH
jgi:hypothetical protein